MVKLVLYLALLAFGFPAFGGADVTVYKQCLDKKQTDTYYHVLRSCQESSIIKLSNTNCEMTAVGESFGATPAAWIEACRQEAGLDSAAPPDTQRVTGEDDDSAPFAASPGNPGTDPNIPKPTARPNNPASGGDKAVTPGPAAPRSPSAPGGATSANEDTQAAESQAYADLSQCRRGETAAQRCCGSATACLSSSNQQTLNQLDQMINSGPGSTGIASYCQKMDTLSKRTGELQRDVGSQCAVNQSSCQSTCASLAQKYANLSNNCQGCANAGLYQSIRSQLQSFANTCQGLRGRADGMSGRGNASGADQAYVRYCKSASNSDPFSIGDLPSDPADDTPAQRAARESAEQMATAAAAVSSSSGEAGFRKGSRKEKPVFNLPDTQDGYSGGNTYGGGTAQAGAAITPVPNNTGGGVPGAGGGGAGAQLGARARGGVSPGSPGYTTEIDRGYQNGGAGFGGYGAGGAEASNGSGFEDRSRRVGAARGTAGRAVGAGMDLRSFLPGGAKDPRRRVAGLEVGLGIHGKGTNIFERVTTKFLEKCRLGKLFDCH